jgi:hypothetical protein
VTAPLCQCGAPLAAEPPDHAPTCDTRQTWERDREIEAIRERLRVNRGETQPLDGGDDAV